MSNAAPCAHQMNGAMKGLIFTSLPSRPFQALLAVSEPEILGFDRLQSGVVRFWLSDVLSIFLYFVLDTEDTCCRIGQRT